MLKLFSLDLYSSEFLSVSLTPLMKVHVNVLDNFMEN